MVPGRGAETSVAHEAWEGLDTQVALCFYDTGRGAVTAGLPCPRAPAWEAPLGAGAASLSLIGTKALHSGQSLFGAFRHGPQGGTGFRAGPGVWRKEPRGGHSNDQF